MKHPKEPKISRRNARGKKTKNPGYEVNNHWNICDVCNCAVRNEDSRLTWDGLVVCPDDWDYRHPQDFVRGHEDDTRPVGLHRPEDGTVNDVPLVQLPYSGDFDNQYDDSPEDGSGGGGDGGADAPKPSGVNPTVFYRPALECEGATSQIVITGSAFVAGSVVSVGSVILPIVSLDFNEIVATVTPDVPDGQHYLKVTSPSGFIATSPAAFTLVSNQFGTYGDAVLSLCPVDYFRFETEHTVTLNAEYQTNQDVHDAWQAAADEDGRTCDGFDVTGWVALAVQTPAGTALTQDAISAGRPLVLCENWNIDDTPNWWAPNTNASYDPYIPENVLFSYDPPWRGADHIVTYTPTSINAEIGTSSLTLYKYGSVKTTGTVVKNDTGAGAYHNTKWWGSGVGNLSINNDSDTTIMFWIAKASVSSQREEVITLGTDDDNVIKVLASHSSIRLAATLGGIGQGNADNSVTNNGMLVTVRIDRDAQTLKLSVNDNHATNPITSTVPIETTSEVTLGGPYNPNYEDGPVNIRGLFGYRGQIEHLVVFDYLLTNSEIDNLYNIGKP